MATILDSSQQAAAVQVDQQLISHIDQYHAGHSADLHFLIVTMAIQGQITPARHLARRLTRTAGVRVTLAIPLSAHRRMFPSSYADADADADAVDQVGAILVDEGLVSYAAYSDGYDNPGFNPDVHDGNHFMAQLKLVGSQTLIRLARSLDVRGRPVTCVLYTILLAWAADVARDVLGIPFVLYWTQPASVFGIYYHYFHGYAEVISARKDDPSFALQLPGLPLLQIKDLPCILIDADSPYLDSYGDIMKVLDKEMLNIKAESSSSSNNNNNNNNNNTSRSRSRVAAPKVLINTFYALEADAIDAISTEQLNLLPIGPIIEKEKESVDIFEEDRSGYIEWLDSKEERSVVYISFGSLSKFSRQQMEEIREGLKESGRPYLWVVRRDACSRDADELLQRKQQQQQQQRRHGMVVEWWNQVRVLSHPSVGCFVTHCGWNSMLESIACGVPMVMVPQWIEQATNAKLAEGVWGVGVRAKVNGEGVMERKELKRCLDVILMPLEGLGEEGPDAADNLDGGGNDTTVLTPMAIRNKAEMWRDKASEAVGDPFNGPSIRSLMALLST